MRNLHVVIEEEAPAEVLFREAKSFADKGEHHYIMAGRYLLAAKNKKPKGISWKNYLTENSGFSTTRANELIRIATGKTTIKKVREVDKERKKKARQDGTPVRPSIENKDEFITAIASDISKIPRDAQVQMVRALMEKLHIGVRDFADGHLKFRR